MAERGLLEAGADQEKGRTGAYGLKTVDLHKEFQHIKDEEGLYILKLQ